jgi:Ca2+:H+ antiporter
MSSTTNSNGFRRESTEQDALLGDSRRNSAQHKRDAHWTSRPAHVWHLTWATLSRDYVNVLLVFVPLGIIAGALKWDSTVIFTLNFLAIVPLASLLSFATEELAATLGQALGGLMNATFGNAVELIVCFFSLSFGISSCVMN